MNRLYVSELTTSDDARSKLVAVLRESADLLTGTSGTAQAPEHVRVPIAYQLAQQLLDAASQLCDHNRISGNGRCRYCHAITVEVK
jgi:cytochrome c5